MALVKEIEPAESAGSVEWFVAHSVKIHNHSWVDAVSMLTKLILTGFYVSKVKLCVFPHFKRFLFCHVGSDGESVAGDVEHGWFVSIDL